MKRKNIFAARFSDFEISAEKENDIVDITEKVIRASKSAGLKNGLIHVSVLHPTAVLIITKNDKRLHEDLVREMREKLHIGFCRHDWARPDGHVFGNGRAFCRAVFAGSGFCGVSVENGRLNLGADQRIFFWEFGEPYVKQLSATFVGEFCK
jgi:secondary thiamine-phosphate synthase enzyme